MKIKALTVNQAWKGRRYKTDKYKAYEKELFLLLPKLDAKIAKDSTIYLNILVGFSNPKSDIDNIAKPFIDILQKKYDFNDCQILKLTMEKVIVKKGDDFIDFDISYR